MIFDEFLVCIQVLQLQDLNRIYILSALIFRDANMISVLNAAESTTAVMATVCISKLIFKTFALELCLNEDKSMWLLNFPVCFT